MYKDTLTVQCTQQVYRPWGRRAKTYAGRTGPHER